MLAAVLVRATVVLIAVSFLALCLRRASAATRHAIWTAAMVGLLVLPLLVLLLPHWHVAVWPATPMPAADVGAAAPAVEAVENLAATSPAAAVERGATPPAIAAPAIVLSRWALAVWCLGVLGGLAHLVAGSLMVRRIVRAAAAPEDGLWPSLLAQATAAVGLSTVVELLETNQVSVPVVCGVRRPRLLLPVDAHSWPDARRRAFLRHELEHVQRRDCLWHCVAGVVRAFYWPHPLVWWAHRRLRAEAERACDDAVVRAGTDGSEYAEHLLEAARSLGRAARPLAVVAIAERSSLEDRLLALLDPGQRRGALTRRAAGVVTGVAAAAILVAAGIQPVRAVAVAAVVAPAEASPSFRLGNAPTPPSHEEPAPPSRQEMSTVVPSPTATVSMPPSSARPTPNPRPSTVVTGLVVDAVGQPVASAIVEAGPARGSRLPSEPARTDEQGRFEIVDAPSGNYGLLIVAPGFITRSLRVDAAEGATTDVGRIVLSNGLAVSGAVVDAAGKPVAGADVGWVKASSRLATLWSKSDAEGHFRLTGITSEMMLFIAMHPEYAPSVAAQLPGTQGDVRIVLTPGGRIEGVVKVKRPGAAPGRAGLNGLMWATKGFGGMPLIGPDGSFVIDHVSPGRTGVAVTLHEGAAGSRQLGTVDTTVDVREGQTSRVEMTVHNVPVRGHLMAGGKPLAGHSVYLVTPAAEVLSRSRQNPMPIGPAPVDEHGRYELIVPIAGTYELFVRGPDKAAVRVPRSQRTVEVPDVDTFPLDITLPTPPHSDEARGRHIVVSPTT
jgi:beta-lactamase regulating signal transducer with metallopeptidase domain